MSANEYYRRFTDLSRYDLEEFYEVLLQIEDSENMPSESEDEEEKNENQMRYDKCKGQSFQKPHKTQNFKRNGVSSSSSSGVLSSNVQMRGGRFAGGSRFHRQRDFGGSGAPLCRRCNNRHFGECRRGSSACYTCGQMGHRAAHCPQNQQRPQQPSLPTLRRPNKLQDLVVMARLVVDVLIIIRATLLFMLQGNISTRRTLFIKVVTLSIREVLCHISHIQQMDPNGFRGDNPNR
ncbi:hypothetical protein FF2_037575 [Malus domestica]